MSKFIPIVNKGELIIKEGRNVAVCTLWTPRDRWEHLLQKMQYDNMKDAVSVIGNLYDSKGIQNMFRNLAANPFISMLIITGKDLNNDLIAEIINAHENGLYMEIRDALGAVHFDMNWLTLIIDKGDGVTDIYPAEADLPTEARYLYPNEVIDNSLEVPYGGALHIGSTLKEAWEQLCFNIQTFGTKYESRYGNTFEIIGLSTVVDSVIYEEGLPFTLEEGEEYANRLLDGSVPDGVSYTYGQRLNGLFDIKKELFSTRHAFWPVFHMEDRGKSEPPCLVSCWFKERKGYLNGIFVFRSHDMYKGYPLNVYGLHRVLSVLADNAGLKVGQIITHSHSAHIYERDFNLSLKSHINMDRAGNFIISVEDDGIQVDLIRDGLLIKRFLGKSSNVLEHELSVYLNSYSHALYLGRELYKAELRLKGLKDG